MLMHIIKNKQVMMVIKIEDKETRLYLEQLDSSLNDYMVEAQYTPEGILNTIIRAIGPILKAKGVSDVGITEFCEKFLKLLPSDFKEMITHIASPPLKLEDHLNKIIDIEDICNKYKINNKDGWITKHKFPGSANVGVHEAWIITMYDNMTNPSNGGDVMYNNKDIIEVKGDGGRLRGQKGYNNGMVRFLDNILTEWKLEKPKNTINYNIGKTTIKDYHEKISLKRDKINDETLKYKEKLSAKMGRMVEASVNKTTKKYQKAKESYEKYKNTIPATIRTLQAEINEIEKNIENCILENISINLTKNKGRTTSIEFFRQIFSYKYDRCSKEKLETFLEKIIDDNGFFSKNFIKEYLIFEYEYYQSIEDFKYFCIVNDKKQLIVDSNESFRKFVYEEIIVPVTTPSFSESSGNQGEVFSIKLNPTL